MGRNEGFVMKSSKEGGPGGLAMVHRGSLGDKSLSCALQICILFCIHVIIQYIKKRKKMYTIPHMHCFEFST